MLDEHIQLRYKNQNRPETDWDSKYEAGTNYLTGRYMDTMLSNGLFFKSAESFDDWVIRGCYNYFTFLTFLIIKLLFFSCKTKQKI